LYKIDTRNRPLAEPRLNGLLCARANVGRPVAPALPFALAAEPAAEKKYHRGIPNTG